MVGIKDVAPDLLMPEGCITRAAPDGGAGADIERGREVLAALGPFDIGQAAVVIDGHVVAVEDIEGTDGLLARVARLRTEGRLRTRPARGVLVKAPKSSQDLALRPADRRPAYRRGRGQSRTCRHCGRGWPCDRGRAAGHDRGRRQGRPVRAGHGRVMPPRATPERKIFLIATEESGDRLGANLMKVLRQRLGGAVRFEGVGGRAMAREGLTSRFAIEELSIIGLAAVVKQLPKILRLIRETAADVVEAPPDVLVIIDSPDFTHRVARTGACARSAHPDRRLCLALGLGVAAGPGARHADLCRPCAGAVAVRAGGLCSIARAALQLCRPSPDRAACSAAAQSPRRRRGGTRRRRCCWCCPGAAAARSVTIWRCSARRSAG